MKKRLLSMLKQVPVWLLFMLPFAAFSQGKVVTGKVTDSKDGSPIAGISVLATGGAKKAGTSTGADGSYKITLPAGTTKLVFTGTGFDKQELDVAGKTEINVGLVAAAASNLNDVVVIGYGTSRVKDLTGSVASVRSKDFNKGAVSPEQLLIGKVAGLQIANNSGQPGGTTITKIRGNNSIVSGSQPLYVIDGIPLDATSPIPNNLGGLTGLGVGTLPGNNPLLFLNPSDIAQVDVLKDASSSAIYGARGENGVVLITTSKGTNRTTVDAGVSYSTYAGLMKQADILSAGQYRQELAAFGQKSDSGQSIDPFKAILQNKLSSKYNVSLSGGNENGKFRASFASTNTEGIILKSGLQQYTASFNGEHYFLDKKLRITFGLIASNYTLQAAPVSTDAGSTGNLISAAMNWNPTLHLVNSDGSYDQANPSGQINPLALSAYTDNYSYVTQILANSSVSYKITPELSYTLLYGLNYGISNIDYQLQGYIVGTGSNADGKGSAVTGTGNLFSQTITHTLQYDKKLSSAINFKILGGYEYYQTSGARFNATGVYGFSWNIPGGPSYPNIPYYNDMQGGNQANLKTVTSVPPVSELQSYFARAEVNIKDRYYVTGTIRADGSSKFGSNNRYGYFPSVGARWNILNEPFMKNNKIFNNLAIRLGYGQTGGQDALQPGTAQSLAYYSSYGVTSTQNFANPNLKWETLTSTNGGVDFGFFHNRLTGYVDVFSKKTTNPLFPGTLSVPSSGATIWQNLPGYISNKGFEVSLTVAVIAKKDFTWNINGNVEYIKNKFVYPALGNSPLFLTGGINGQGVSSAYAEAIANGQPIDVFYLRTFQGFDANGIAKVASQASSYVGDPNPHFVMGLNTDLNYKKFSLAINTHGAFGNDIFNNTLVSVTNLGNIANGKNISKTLIGTQESLANPVSASTRFLQSGNFVKIGNVTLSYNIGNISNIVKNARFFVTGANLFEITKYTGFDAEVNQDHNNAGVPSLGMDYIGYPTARTLTFGLNFSLY